ncbi:MAG: hypothetical protein WKF63_01690, partial [Thermomicrobiales bacterium]
MPDGEIATLRYLPHIQATTDPRVNRSKYEPSRAYRETLRWGIVHRDELHMLFLVTMHIKETKSLNIRMHFAQPGGIRALRTSYGEEIQRSTGLTGTIGGWVETFGSA